MRLIAPSLDAVGHTSADWAHVVVCSPVAGLHLSLKLENGIEISVKLLPAGTENLALKQPRDSGIEPPPAQAYDGETVPEANETRNPSYSGVVERTRSTREPPAAADASANLPSAAALMNPGALSDGTSTTSPSKTPNEPLWLQVPLDFPPITGSLSSVNVKLVPAEPCCTRVKTSESGGSRQRRCRIC